MRARAGHVRLLDAGSRRRHSTVRHRGLPGCVLSRSGSDAAGWEAPAGIAFANYNVYFALNSAALDDEAMSILRMRRSPRTPCR